MVRAVQKLMLYADAFQRSIISEAIYHFTLASLHWLCASERIQFKLAMLIFKSLHGLAPQYLVDGFTRV